MFVFFLSRLLVKLIFSQHATVDFGIVRVNFITIRLGQNIFSFSL